MTDQQWLHQPHALRRAYKRKWALIQRAGGRQAVNQAIEEGRAYRVVGSLHSLSCTGPTRSKGCRCRKTTVLERMERAA